MTLVAGTSVGIAARYGVVGPTVLGPGIGQELGATDARVGEWFDAFYGEFYPRGSAPVHIRAIRVTGVPRQGLRVVGLHALDNGLRGGTDHGDVQKEYPGQYDYRPVREMVLTPGKPEHWTLLIIVEAVAPGDWHTTGLDIDWSAGWRRGTTHFKYRVGMTVRA